MTLAIHRLVADEPLAEEAVDRFLDEHSFPIVEGPSLTFVYRGAAERVSLQHFIYGLPTSQPFLRVDGSDLWYLVLELPKASRLQYKFHVVRAEAERLILDPLNPQRAHDPYGANSVCHSEGSERPPWTFPDPEVRPGELRELELKSDAFGEKRTVRLYLPAEFIGGGRRTPIPEGLRDVKRDPQTERLPLGRTRRQLPNFPAVVGEVLMRE